MIQSSETSVRPRCGPGALGRRPAGAAEQRTQESCRLRRRRGVKRWLAALVAMAAASAGCSAGATPSTTSSPRSTITASSTAASTSTTVPPCVHYGAGLSFVNELDGFAMFSDCSGAAGRRYRLYASTDGGASWRPVARLSFAARAASVPAPGGFGFNHLSFVSRSFGVAYLGDEILVTTDAGLRWHSEAVSGVVAKIFTSDGAAWAVVLRPCGSGECDTSVVPVLLSRLGAPRPLPAHYVTDVVAFGRTWYAGPANKALWVSHDLGKTWQPHAFPIRRNLVGAEQIAAARAGVVWVACELAISAGAEAKSIFLSLNGGLTWKETAQAAAFNITRSIGQLSATGYVAGMAAVSARRAVLRIGSPVGRIEVSRDGGVVWAVLGIPSDGGSPTFGVECVGNSCWTSGPNAVYRSTDGGAHWSRSAIWTE